MQERTTAHTHTQTHTMLQEETHTCVCKMGIHPSRHAMASTNEKGTSTQHGTHHAQNKQYRARTTQHKERPNQRNTMCNHNTTQISTSEQHMEPCATIQSNNKKPECLHARKGQCPHSTWGNVQTRSHHAKCLLNRRGSHKGSTDKVAQESEGGGQPLTGIQT